MNNVKVGLIHVDKIRPHPDNPRDDVRDVDELARSLKATGQLQSCLVQPDPKHPGEFLLLAGERRWTAAKEAGEPRLVCIIFPHQARASVLMLSLVENGHRKDLNPMEIAVTFGDLVGNEHIALTDIAARTGYSLPSIRRYLMLLDLSPDTQEQVRAGKITVGKALTEVRRARAARRESSGQGKPGGVTVRHPDHFTALHPLAEAAETRCAAAGHTGRYRYGGIACGQCWEATAVEHALADAGHEHSRPVAANESPSYARDRWIERTGVAEAVR